jgi:DNA-binding GntR family transcriptional regulator
MEENSIRRAIRWQKESGDALSQQVYRRLRDQIFSFELKPFQIISEKQISLELGVSRTPAREALMRLSEQGLVDILPQRGSVIAPFRLPDLEKSQFLREALEVALLTRAMEHSDCTALVKELNAELALQKIFVQSGDAERFYASDETFHGLIAKHSGLPSVLAEIERTKIHMDRFRRLMLKGIEDLNNILPQHVDIVSAIEAGDVTRAVKAMQTHLRRILVFTKQAIKLHPEYFEEQLPEFRDRFSGAAANRS